ncbi:hypothetical protein LJC04_05135, partial [Ruminococcaceae bacterium OttesenSCG-928-O06]|nr:hypothetical protein [Ruminococcaceae bacterium OttesenSCG-928-O06]
LLYISSFGYASMSDDEVQELSDMAGTDFAAFADVNRHSMATTLHWFDRYLTDHPDVQLVYRRHPSEWEHPALREMEQKHPGFHVIFEEGVKQWIHVADHIYVWMSSAVAEVYFARKSCVVVRPAPVPHQFDPVIYKNCAAAASYDEFAAAAQAEDVPFPIAPGVIDRYFSSEEAPAYLRMADLLEDVHKNPPRGTPFDDAFRPHFNWLKCFALFGVHVLFALRCDPIRFKRIAPKTAAFASRIYGYVAKAYVPKAQVQAMRRHIRQFLPGEGRKAQG